MVGVSTCDSESAGWPGSGRDFAAIESAETLDSPVLSRARPNFVVLRQACLDARAKVRAWRPERPLSHCDEAPRTPGNAATPSDECDRTLDAGDATVGCDLVSAYELSTGPSQGRSEDPSVNVSPNATIILAGSELPPTWRRPLWPASRSCC